MLVLFSGLYNSPDICGTIVQCYLKRFLSNVNSVTVLCSEVQVFHKSDTGGNANRLRDFDELEELLSRPHNCLRSGKEVFRFFDGSSGELIGVFRVDLVPQLFVGCLTGVTIVAPFFSVIFTNFL